MRLLKFSRRGHHRAHIAWCPGGCSRPARDDILIADFEAETYGHWKATGSAFGDGPAHGTLAGQMEVSGFEGKRLANSFHGGDSTIGTLASPPFEIKRRYLNFLIGGGMHAPRNVH